MNKYKVNSAKIDKISVRLKSVKDLIKLNGITLDCGGRNEFAETLGINNFIESDLNYPFKKKHKYDNATSFEVIEHLQNPLLYLESIKNCLNNNGKLFLTTPVRWIFKGKFHFHEYSKDELFLLFNMAGFKVISIKRIQAYNLNHFGIRPLIKKIRDLIFGQCFFIIAEK